LPEPNPFSLAVDPSNKFVYVTNASPDSISAYSLSASTGELTRIDCDSATAGVQKCLAGSGPTSVVVDPTGKFAYVANSGGNSVSVFSINAGTGLLTRIDCDPSTAGVQDCVAGIVPASVAVDPTGKFVYVANYGNGASPSSVSAYSINASTGVLTKINCITSSAIACNGTDFLAGTGPQAIAITGGVQ
jgi:6-phosphogluconolactonase (cycloisomerase 2 family)